MTIFYQIYFRFRISIMIILATVCIVSWARFAGRGTEECYSGARPKLELGVGGIATAPFFIIITLILELRIQNPFSFKMGNQRKLEVGGIAPAAFPFLITLIRESRI